MVFTGEYYIANTYEEQAEAIAQFYENDNYKSMVIIDECNMIERYKEIRGDLSIGITWLTEGSIQYDEKTIYIIETFNDLARNYVLNNLALVMFV
jgi:hypothetical protein